MKAFLRENLMIVVSIALPLLVTVLFVVASLLPGLYVSPPSHDLLLTLQGGAAAGQSRVRLNFVLEDDQLRVMVSKLDEPGHISNPRLFRYEHDSGQVREISIPIPQDASDGSEIHVPGISGLRVDGTLSSPDGYEYRGRRRGGGLMTELFGGARRSTDVSIARDGRVIRVRLPSVDYWYNDIRFLGWVIE
jgi:hypothetical protein